MADGSVTFSTELDNSGIQKDLNAAKREIEKATKSIKDSQSAKLPLVKQVEGLGPALDEAKAKLYDLQKQQAAVERALNNPDPGAYIDAVASKPELDSAVIEQNKQVEKLQKQWDSVNDKIDKYDQKIVHANNTIAEQQKIAGDLSAKLTVSSSNTAKATNETASASAKASREMSKMARATDKAQKTATSLGKRMTGIVNQVFLFGMVFKALYGVAEYMGKALKSNKEFTMQLAKLKGALLIAFQPIYELLVPALMALMRIATSVAQGVAHVFSLIGGKSSSEYAKNAKALYEQAGATEAVGDAAEKTKKSLAGFDEINQLGSTSGANSEASSEAVSPDFSSFETAEYKKKIDELVVYISAALLVLGVILTFSGANIPLGIGLMAAGAIGLATEAAVNWDAMKQILEEKAGLIAGISGILLVLGLILALSGCAIPLGIGLIAVGAVGLAATAAVNWDSIVQALQGPIGGITAIASAALLVIGLILVCTGVGIPLGIALIVAGAAGLVTVTAVNWNFIKDKLSEMWSGVKQWWSSTVAPVFTKKYWAEKFKTMADGFANSWKNGINSAITVINNFIAWINDKLHFKWDALTIAGVQIVPAVDYQLFSIPQIPHLARGAVLPPNKPFMAVVGDQTHGTNVEAPLSTIQEAVAIVMEDMIASNMAGHEATVAVLREILEAILGIQIGDDVIGQAVARYNAKMATIRGGAT